MRVILEGIEFLINNFWKLSIITFAAIISLFFLHKIIKELLLNHKLSRFHVLLRNQKTRLRKQRMAVLTGLVLIPIIFMSTFIQIIRNPMIQYDNHVLEIDDFDQFMSVIYNYNGKFPDNYVRFFEMSSLMFNEDAPNDIETSIDYPPVVLDLDVVVRDNDYVYILGIDQIDILSIDTLELIGQPIVLPLESSTNQTVLPIGLFVDENYITVIAHAYEVGSRHFWNSETLSPKPHDASAVHVLIYHKDDLSILHNRFEIDGYLETIYKVDQRLLMAIQERITFSNDMDWEEAQPRIYEGSGALRQAHKLYQQVIYIEGTKPNGFTSLVSLDIDNNDVSHKVVLGDCLQKIVINEEDFYIASTSYTFKNISDYFDFFDPIADRRIAMTIFSHNESDILYRQTKIIPGNTVLANSMNLYEDQLRMITIENLVDKTYRIAVIDQNNHYIINQPLTGVSGDIVSVHYKDHLLFITMQDGKFYKVDLSNPSEVGITHIEGHSGFPYRVFNYTDTHIIGLDISIQNDNQPEGIRLSIHHLNVEQNLSALFYNPISYDTYGHVSTTAFYQPSVLSRDPSNEIIVLPINTLDGKQTSSSGVLVYQTTDLALLKFITHDIEYAQSAYRVIVTTDKLFVVSRRCVTVWDVNNFDNHLKRILLIKEE